MALIWEESISIMTPILEMSSQAYPQPHPTSARVPGGQEQFPNKIDSFIKKKE